MRVKRGGRDVKVEVRADGEGLVSHAGAALIAETADRLGLDERARSRAGGLFERTPTHSPGRVIRDLAVMLADGGAALCDLGAVRDQQALFGPVASDCDGVPADRADRRRAGRAGAAAGGARGGAGAGVAARRAAATGRDRPRRDAVDRALRQGGRGGQLQGRVRLSPDARLPGRQPRRRWPVCCGPATPAPTPPPTRSPCSTPRSRSCPSASRRARRSWSAPTAPARRTS